MVEFAIILMSPLGGRRQRVAVVDICHSELHVHVYNQQEDEIGHERIRIGNTQKDVEDSYEAGVDHMLGNWEDCKRRWRDG